MIVQHFSKYGVPDGILAYEIADIKSLDSESVYLKGIQTLIDRQEETCSKNLAVTVYDF